MAKYYSQKFDAKAYWATKPLCIICKEHKVKNGTICHRCKKRNMENKEVLSSNPIVEKPTAFDDFKKVDTEYYSVAKEPKLSQIKYDKSFIKKLLDKLKTGNSRAIHLNAVPGRSATRLDLCQLGDISSKIPTDFIETLLSKEGFSFPISFDKVDLNKADEEKKNKLTLISKKLNNIVIENEDSFLEFGLKNFGFGYPLLIKRDQNDPTKIIKAPLFIWDLDITRSYQNKNHWTIKKEEDSAIKINELLISHLSKDESVKIEKISKEIIDDGVLAKNELIELTENILKQLNSPTSKLKIKIEKCPDVKQIDAIANSKAWIQWSGVFGIYRSQNETIIHATEELLERFDEFDSEKLILEQFQTSSITAVETDPSKEEIIDTLTKDEIKLIQGPPGTGKSQSITAVVANALANNAKCLIVCEKKTALDVINANLEKIGLADFSVVIDDVNKDRKKVIQKARAINEVRTYPFFSKIEFETKYNKFKELKKELNSKYGESLKRIFGDFSWKELIGLYLRYSKLENLEKITEALNYEQVKFDHQEYTEYLSMVEEATFLFEEMEKGSEEFFSGLNSELFLSSYTTTIKEKLSKELNKTILQIEGIKLVLSKIKQSDCEKEGISLFNPSTIEECDSLTTLIADKLKEIISLYEEGISLAGDNFNNRNFIKNLKIQLSAIFNRKNRKIYTIRKTIPVIIKETLEKISEINKLGFEDIKLKQFDDCESCHELKKNATDTLAEINKIKLINQKIKEKSRQLNKIDKEIADIIDEKIFNIKIKDHLTLGSYDAMVGYYSEMLEKLVLINKNKDSYQSFHNWMFFISNKTKFELLLLKALQDYLVENWKNIFTAWYFRGVLQDYESKSTTGFNKSDSKLHQLGTIYNELKKMQIQQIKSIWGSSRREKLSAINYNFNTLYSLRRNNAGPKSSLRKIIDVDYNLFTTLFPVILTNPIAANAILPLTQGLFNVVIFDESSQLRISDTFTSLIRGQYKIIAGDEHQMPPSSYFQSTAELLDNQEGEEYETTPEEDEQSTLAESESLLQFASDLHKINKSYLDFHYRSNHPALIDFSNCAFYGGNLIPFPAQEEYKPIEFKAVNGRYETRTNPKEVLEIIKIIKDDIHPDQSGKYPSLGIATFNINQRNLITEALNEFAEKDPALGRKLQGLRESGLFVKNLENIQGDEKDIIIISTTYGIQPDGKFSQNFARLNRIEGYKLLNVLITRAKHKLYVCTSIPKERYLTYPECIQNEGNNKRGILYAYLAYAEAVSNKDTEVSESILKLLKAHSLEEPRAIADSDGLSESPFEEEVYESLLDHFKKENIIQQHKVGGFRLDFVIKTKTKNVALECDGKEYHQSEEAYAHDMYREKELKNMGFVIYRIWSTNWFSDKETEMQKLLRFIESLDK